MQRDPDRVRQSIATEVLDLAMLNNALIILSLNFALVVAAGYPGHLLVVGILLVDALVVFLVTPYLVAWWLEYDVDALLDPNQTLQPSSAHHEES